MVNGHPLFYIEDRHFTESVEETFGLFTYELGEEVRKVTPDFPQDYLAVGDNWFQVTHLNPVYIDSEDKLFNMENGDVYAVFRMMSRLCRESKLDQKVEVDDPVKDLIEDTERDIISGFHDEERILTKLAVFDYTSVGFPVFSNESDVFVLGRKVPWGRILKLNFYPPVIYHVTNLNFKSG